MRVYILDDGWLEGDENWLVAMETYATAQNKQAKINESASDCCSIPDIKEFK